MDCGGNYSYKVIISSFTGYRAETTIVVKENKVVERKLETGTPNFLGKPAPLKLEWMETGKDIGSHTKAVEPRTLDELYMLAKKLLSRMSQQTMFEALELINKDYFSTVSYETPVFKMMPR